MEFVNGKDYIPYMKWKMIEMFETTHQLGSGHRATIPTIPPRTADSHDLIMSAEKEMRPSIEYPELNLEHPEASWDYMCCFPRIMYNVNPGLINHCLLIRGVLLQ